MTRRFYCQARSDSGSGGGQRVSAFSLLELLVVVGIIVLLISLILPSLRKSVRQAASTVCMSNLKQIGQAIDFYKFDNNGWVPTTDRAEASNGRPVSTWFQKLVGTHLSDPNVLVCPEDPYRAWLLHNDSLIVQNPESIGSSYGMNAFIQESPDHFLCNLDRFSPKRPLNTLFLADMGPDAIRASGSGGGRSHEPSRSNGVVSWHDGFSLSAQPQGPWITRRHLGGINVLMMSGGVHEIETRGAMSTPIESFYAACAAGECTLCVKLEPHYSFAISKTYWWTGALPTH